MLDGALARVKGTSGTFGAFLDSTLDRVADAAIFGGLTLSGSCCGGTRNHVLASGDALLPGGRGSGVVRSRPGPRAWELNAERRHRRTTRADGGHRACRRRPVRAGRTICPARGAVAAGGGISAVTFGSGWHSRCTGLAAAACHAPPRPEQTERAAAARRGSGIDVGRTYAVPGLKDLLVSTGYGAGWSVVCRVPESWASGGDSGFVTDIAWRRQGHGVQGAGGQPAAGARPRRHGRRAAGGLAGWPCGPTAVLAGGIPAARDARISELVQRDMVDDSRHIVEDAFADRLAAGRGVVFALPHMGNWEVAGRQPGSSPRGPGSSSPPWRSGSSPSRFTSGSSPSARDSAWRCCRLDGGPAHSAILAQRLRAGKVVCLPCDRDLTGQRRRGGLLRREGPDGGRSRPRWPCRPGRRCCRPCCGFTEGDGWGVHRQAKRYRSRPTWRPARSR